MGEVIDVAAEFDAAVAETRAIDRARQAAAVLSEDETRFFDWDQWGTSARGNPWLQQDDCRVTIFPSREWTGYCWCVDWARRQPRFSLAIFANQDEARAAAWRDEVAPGLTLIAEARAAAEGLRGGLARLTPWQRRLVAGEIERWSGEETPL